MSAPPCLVVSRELVEWFAQVLWDMDRADFRTGGDQPAHDTWQDTGEACEWEHQNGKLRQFQRRLARRILKQVVQAAREVGP